MRHLCAVALLVCVVSVAHAQVDVAPLDLDEAAAEHFKLAIRAYQAGQWDAARAEFRVCYELSQKPDLLHNLSMVAEQQGNAVEALALEREFLAKAKGLTTADRTAAVGRIARIERGEPASAPEPASPPPAVPARSKPPSAAQLLPPIGVATGGALLVAALGTGIAGSLLRADLESHPLTLPELDAGRSQAQRLQTATITLGVVGGALVLTSAAVLISTRRRAK